MYTLIKNGRVIDPATGKDDIYDVLISDQHIKKVEKNIPQNSLHVDTQILDAAGYWVVPGLIDLHVHLREPGFEYKETIRTGAMAAAHGGYTTICPMPNTKPATDSPEMIRLIIEKAAQEAPIHVLPVGAVTLGQIGKEMTDIKGMAKAGAIAISEDGKSVMDTELYRQAMIQAKEAGIPVLAHCEDRHLVGQGALNAGPIAEKLGVCGIGNEVEDVITARDILLAKATGCRLHLCHCSTEDSVKMVAAAQADGVDVTAEVCPHHFTLTQDDIKEDDANYKMNPPVRAKADKDALIAGISKGIMGVIATDHAPHSEEEKLRGIAKAPFGIVGSETAVALTMTELVHKGLLTPFQMVERMSYLPAKVINIDKGSLAEGKIADITIIDPEMEYVIDKEAFVSKGKNTPFHGYHAKGGVVMTICDGNIVYHR